MEAAEESPPLPPPPNAAAKETGGGGRCQLSPTKVGLIVRCVTVAGKSAKGVQLSVTAAAVAGMTATARRAVNVEMSKAGCGIALTAAVLLLKVLEEEPLPLLSVPDRCVGAIIWGPPVLPPARSVWRSHEPWVAPMERAGGGCGWWVADEGVTVRRG